MAPTSNRNAVVLAGALLACLAGAASAENYGRITKPHEVVTTEISPGGDEDAYVFEGAPGFQLKAQVKKGKTGDLAPAIELIAPDGSVEATGNLSKTSSTISKAVLASSGRYALRIRAVSGSGPYSLKWSLKPAKVPPVKNMPFGADTTTELSFPAAGGALVSWSLKYKGNGGTEVSEIRDPLDAAVPYDPDVYVVAKGTTQKGNSIPIPADRPGGAYALVVRNLFSPNTASITFKVVFPKVKPVPVTLSAAEPSLAGVAPDHGGFGVAVVLTGTNLEDPPTSVRFGGSPGTEAAVTGGTSCSVKPPAGTGTVDVVLTNPDGQVAVLPAGFTYYPPPTPSSFAPADGPANGLQTLTVTGSGFRVAESGLYKVLVGGNQASQVTVQDAATITCLTPVGVAGPTSVRVVDAYQQQAVVPGTYTYKAAPTILSIAPNACPVGISGVPMTITGQGFSAVDVVYVAGNPVASTLVLNPIDFSVIGHRITIPTRDAAAGPGKVNVEVRDNYGQSSLRVNGLAYYRFTDATVAAMPAVSGAEDYGGVANAVVDKDGNGTVDWLLVAHTTSIGGTKPGTRLLVNNGSGVFADLTSTKMPAVTATEDVGANRILVGRMSGDAIPDVYLSRAGTGVEARTDSPSSFYVVGWGALLFPDSNGYFTLQPNTGAGKKFSVPSIPHCDACWNGPKCELFDYDFRSVNAAMGDLDGDGDQDIVLVNDASINRFLGSGTYAVYIGCGFSYPGRVTWANYATYTYGSAMRICTTGSSGGSSDNTKTLLNATFTVNDDFRAMAACVADLNADFLNDIVITWNGPITTAGGSPRSATRAFKQGNTGTSVEYKPINGFLPVPSTAADDDWRGEAVAAADFSQDFLRDLVVCMNGPVLGGAKFSTRVLFQNPDTGTLVDKTAEVLGTPAGSHILPTGDDGRAKFVLAQDVDKDGDQDILISTPDDVGGNRRTRFLLNVGAGAFVDASSVLPPYATDNGNALSVVSADIDGDGDNDLILTDTTLYGAGGSRPRTRVWKQER